MTEHQHDHDHAVRLAVLEEWRRSVERRLGDHWKILVAMVVLVGTGLIGLVTALLTAAPIP